MAIGGVGSYSNYTNSYTRNNVSKTESTESSAITKEEFLKELKEQYPNVNIMTARVTKSNEKNYAGSGTGLRNLVISEKYLEEIANDPQKRLEFKQTMKEMEDATQMKINRAKGDNIDLHSSGFIIDEDGGMSSWSGMRKTVSKNDGSSSQMSTQYNSQNTLFEKMKENSEKRRLEQKEQEEKRIEKNKLERKERQEDEEKRLEEKRQEKKLAEKSAITEANENYDDNAINNRNRLAIDKYKTELGYENGSTSFSEEI